MRTGELVSLQYEKGSFTRHDLFEFFKFKFKQSTYIGKTDGTLFIRTHEHAISDKESAIYKHLRTCEHLVFSHNLCDLPDTLNPDNAPPVLTKNKEYFTHVVRNNTTVLDCDHNWNLLL